MLCSAGGCRRTWHDCSPAIGAFAWCKQTAGKKRAESITGPEPIASWISMTLNDFNTFQVNISIIK